MLGEEKNKYQVGEKIYIQKALVIGQIRLVTDLLKTIDLPKTIDVPEIVNSIGGVISEAMAIVLMEESMVKATAKELAVYFSAEAIKERVEEFTFKLGSDVIVEAVNDFLSCNPITSGLELIKTVVSNMYQVTPAIKIVEEKTEAESTGSIESVSTLQTET
jgi:hypothetical protein